MSYGTLSQVSPSTARFDPLDKFKTGGSQLAFCGFSGFILTLAIWILVFLLPGLFLARSGRKVIKNKQKITIQAVKLAQNHPNPFNPTTSIQCELPKASAVKLSVFDMLGREAQVLVNEVKQPGRYDVVFDSTNEAIGVSFYRIQAGSYADTKSFVLIRWRLDTSPPGVTEA